ncbi:hypothetical protein E8E13_009829 [Curvularia kusanoi]|uniref:Uncharacterized protein n=1 Tax=Curvularia kusanoi TaxID=90978 RepID=A0A9P4TI14_CURKU|nr:hypothetical protein E8E13_009829 [Curvularia kusanoi]
MPWIPPEIDPNILSDIDPDEWGAWIDGKHIPEQGPHTSHQCSCTVNQDITLKDPDFDLRKGMQGHILQERDSRDGEKEYNVHIQGVTRYLWVDRWVTRLWVSARYIDKEPVQGNTQDVQILNGASTSKDDPKNSPADKDAVEDVKDDAEHN